MKSTAGARSAGQRGNAVLLAVVLIWFVGWLWLAHTTIVGAGSPAGALIQMADALPAVIAASLLTGAAAGLVAVGRWPVPARWRWPLSAGTGALAGAVAAILILLGYGHRASIVTLAATLLVAGVLGGLLGGLPPGEIVAAGILGTLAANLVAAGLHLFQSPLTQLMGAGSSPGSQLAAASRLALTTALLAGLAAGVAAFGYLRRTARDGHFLRYLSAGAFPGVLLLVTELVARIGGGQVFQAVSNLSAGDRTYVQYWGNSRLNHALILLFVGGIGALLCLGRTLRTPSRQPTAKVS
jgi:hypothetical protein